MKCVALILTVALTWTAWAQPNDRGFVPGHVLVSEQETEPCFEPNFGNSILREVDRESRPNGSLRKEIKQSCSYVFIERSKCAMLWP